VKRKKQNPNSPRGREVFHIQSKKTVFLSEPRESNSGTAPRRFFFFGFTRSPHRKGLPSGGEAKPKRRFRKPMNCRKTLFGMARVAANELGVTFNSRQSWKKGNEKKRARTDPLVKKKGESVLGGVTKRGEKEKGLKKESERAE